MKYGTLRLFILFAGALVLLLSMGALWNGMWLSAGIAEFAGDLRHTPSAGETPPGGLTNAEIAKEMLDIVNSRGPRSFSMQAACAFIGLAMGLVAIFARDPNREPVPRA